MHETTIILDGLSGDLLLEGPTRHPDLLDGLARLLGEPQDIACARPSRVQHPAESAMSVSAPGPAVEISGYYHGSLIEGPGRRSVALFTYCPLRCKGCLVPELHARGSGTRLPVSALARLLMDPAYDRDGVSLLGGEPFGQPEALWGLVRELRSLACSHLCIYSGYTLEALQRQSRSEPSIGAVLREIDLLIDGPFVARLAGGAGPWTGSGNQRLIVLKRGVPVRILRAGEELVLWPSQSNS